jgi:hypothetical protein
LAAKAEIAEVTVKVVFSISRKEEKPLSIVLIDSGLDEVKIAKLQRDK